MIRVLQIIDHMESGGIQAFVMNVYRHINREEIQFDFLLHHQGKHSYYHEIEELGGRIYYVEPRSKGLLVNRRSLKDFFSTHPEYKVIHMHESSLSYLVPLEVAAKFKVPIRIFHSHSSSILGSKLHHFLHWWHKREIGRVANRYLACGELALKWMYGNTSIENRAQIVYNGICLSDYQFDNVVRSEVRKELGIENELVIVHTGRFDKVKNHYFLIDIAKALSMTGVKYKLLLIGNGSMFDNVKIYAKEKEVDNSVYFLGVRNDVNRLLSAADIFVLPSFYEGFPVVAIEAMAAGLPVIMSDTISSEVAIKDNVVLKSLSAGAEIWASDILELADKRIVNNSVLYDRGFDIANTVEKLRKIYLG